jgi:uncharacterized protein YecE (DUF72 family)
MGRRGATHAGPAPHYFRGPKLPAAAGTVANTSTVYYRSHGVPELYKSPYSPAFLARIADEVEATENVREVYLLFNNGIGAVGVENARQMQQLLQAEH